MVYVLSKANDVKFEPTPEIPALQFLESVDKESNADKAGLKPLDFVLEVCAIILFEWAQYFYKEHFVKIIFNKF